MPKEVLPESAVEKSCAGVATHGALPFDLSNLLQRTKLGLLIAAAVSACNAQLPDCPDGVDFGDCRPTGVMMRPLDPSNTGGSGAAVTNGGTSSTLPSMGGTSSEEDPGVTDIDMPGAGGTSGMGGTGAVTNPPSMVDNCPTDPAKSAPGVCGCGVPDDDFDADAVPDCRDDCPDNADRALPTGACGCSTLADTAGCQLLRDAVRNLYTFDGTGIVVEDSKGNDDGTLFDASGIVAPADLQNFQINGRMNLDGGGAFVELPPGLLSSMTSATLESWVAWRGNPAWARIFDFGTNDGNAGLSYLFLTPANSLTNTLRVAYSIAGPGAAETLIDGMAPMPLVGAAGGAIEHTAVVIDAAQGQMRLYANGVQVGAVALTGTLAAINDDNNWLGRSNFPVDPFFFGALVEFRIYDRALTAAQLGTSFQAGPGALN